MVEDKVILELKHIRENFIPTHYVQLISYLKFWGKDLGLLMNFGGDRLYFKRVPYSPRQGELEMAGKWNELEQDCPKLVNVIKTACENILSKHGLGYSKNTFEKLLMCELKYLLNDIQNPVVNLRYGDLDLGERVADCLVADSRLVLKTSALPENTSSVDLVRLQSFMTQVNIPFGMLVNFGKSTLLLRAVSIK